MEALTVEGMTMKAVDRSLVRVTWEGQATATSVAGLRDFANRHRELGGASIGSILDATGATGVERSARKILNEFGKDKPWDYLAVFGVSFEIRVLVEMIIKALRLLQIDTAQIEIFDTEAEAVAWIDARLQRGERYDGAIPRSTCGGPVAESG